MNFAGIYICFLLTVMFLAMCKFYFWKTETPNKAHSSSIRKMCKEIERKNNCRLLDLVQPELDERAMHKILRFFRNENQNENLWILLNIEQGGDSGYAHHAMNIIRKSLANVTVFVPEIASSAGAQIALAADNLVLGKNARLTPFDDQISGFPCKNIVRFRDRQNKEKIRLSLADYSDIQESKYLTNLMEREIEILVGNKNEEKPRFNSQVIENIRENFLFHKYYHSYPIGGEKLFEIGIEFSENFPISLYKLFDKLWKKESVKQS